MGSPLSPVIANMVMEDLKSSVIQSLGFTLKTYFRYVDDILIIAPTNKISFIQDQFNKKHNRLKFTIEHMNENNLRFLDLSINRIDGGIKLDWS